MEKMEFNQRPEEAQMSTNNQTFILSTRGRRPVLMGDCIDLWMERSIRMKEDGSELSLIKWLTPSSGECGVKNY